MRVPRSGVTYAPEFEWLLAARWAGYTLREYRRLSGDEQSEILALYRGQVQIDAVLAQEERRRAERKK